MKPNPVGWFEIYVEEMPRAKAFYEAVFQFTMEPLPAPSAPDGEACGGEMEMWAFPMVEQAYGAAGALIRVDGVPTGAGGTLVYFSCEDCAEEAARAVASGGALVRENRVKMSLVKKARKQLDIDTEKTNPLFR